MPTFEDLGLEPYLVRALGALSIKLPSEVQSACIPPILAGRDCIASAQTGSGKTLAFALPMLQHLSQDPYGIFAVVLTPTRELAFQIHDQFKAVGISGGLSLQSTVAVGGLDMMAQATELRKRPHVVVATPGRLADLLTNSSAGEWDFSRVKYLVLDEADRLLAPSFAKELGTLIQNMPSQRQTLLFTATMTDSILALRDKPPAPGKDKPFVHLSENMVTTPATLSQRYLFTPSSVRDVYLFYLLTHVPSLLDIRSAFKRKSDAEHAEREPLCQAIIFISRCKSAQHLSHTLTELDISNAPLHSHLTQKERLASLAAFRASSVPLLIATDVGARGLDIPEVDLVINWDLPREPDDYVHRVGRTARAGKSGTSLSIVCEGDVDLLKAIEERVGQCKPHENRQRLVERMLGLTASCLYAAGTTMTELRCPEDSVLEHLNKVSTAQRVASIQCRREGVGERQEINKKKQAIREKEARRKSKAAKSSSSKVKKLAT